MPTVNIPITKDTYVSSFNPDTNFSSSTTMSIGVVGTTRYAYLETDLSSLPPNAFIISATLKIYNENSEVSTVPLVLTEVGESWELGNITYNNRPALGSYSKSLGIVPPTSAFQADITEFIKGKVEGDYIYGFRLSTTGSNLTISSSRSLTESQRPVLEVVYSNFAPVVPSPNYPVNVSIDRTQDLTLRWSSPDHLRTNLIWNDGVEHDVTIEGNVFEYTISGNTITAGQVSWKVRNEYTEVGYSEFSTEVFFTAANKPPAPVINETTVTEKLPTFTWTETNQVLFNFVVELAGSKIVDFIGYSETGSYTLTKELQDETECTFKVRYQDANGIWSDYDTLVATTSFVKPGTPSIVLTNNGNYATIDITNGLNVDYNLLMKLVNGVYEEVKVIDEAVTSIDYYGLKSGVLESLKIRSVSPEGGIADSNVETVTVTVNNTHIITDDLAIELTLSDTPSISFATQKEVYQAQYQGRLKPISIIGDWKTKIPNFQFETFTYSEVAVLESMVGEKVFIRNSRGEMVVGVFSQVTSNYQTISTIISIRNFIEVGE